MFRIKKEINQKLDKVDVLKREILHSNIKSKRKILSDYNKHVNEIKSLITKLNEHETMVNFVENIDKLSITNNKIVNMKMNQVSNYSKIKELIRNGASMEEKGEEILNYLNINSKIIKNYEKTRNYHNVNYEDYIITNELPTITKNKKIDKQDQKVKIDSEYYNLSKQKTIDIDIEENELVDNLENELVDNLENEENLQDVLDSEQPIKPDLYSRFKKGKAELAEADLPEAELAEANIEQQIKKENVENKKMLAPPVNLDLEELELGDDLEELQNQYNSQEEDGDINDQIKNYKFNSKKKMTEEAKKRLEIEREVDKSIPINLDNEIPEENSQDNDENQNNDVENRAVKPEILENEHQKEEQMSRKELNKISRQLQKEADENIKVIELDPNLSLKPKKCDDSKTKRSSIKTTNMVKGRKRRQKDIDPDLKNCIFPFKMVKGRGKNKVETYHNECLDNGVAPMCATDRKEDCRVKNWAYCDLESK